MPTPEKLIPALRQYKHNDGSEGFVTGYDIDEVNKVFAELEAQHADLVNRNAFLRERPDLPVDRIPVYKRMTKQIAELEEKLKFVETRDLVFKTRNQIAAQAIRDMLKESNMKYGHTTITVKYIQEYADKLEGE